MTSLQGTAEATRAIALLDEILDPDSAIPEQCPAWKLGLVLATIDPGAGGVLDVYSTSTAIESRAENDGLRFVISPPSQRISAQFGLGAEIVPGASTVKLLGAGEYSWYGERVGRQEETVTDWPGLDADGMYAFAAQAESVSAVKACVRGVARAMLNLGTSEARIVASGLIANLMNLPKDQ